MNIIDYIIPRTCPVCADIVTPRGEKICRPCRDRLEYVSEPRCKKCGKSVISDNIEYCYDCTKNPKSYEEGVALFNYNEVIKKSIYRFKYANKREYADFYAEELVKKYGKYILSWGADCLIPVPVHPKKEIVRGFNQAEIIAKSVGALLNLPIISDRLIRVVDTAPQKELNDIDRKKNLEKAFAVRSTMDNINKAIIVDDIYTTGSTVEMCTQVLKRAGVEYVYYVSLSIGKGY